MEEGSAVLLDGGVDGEKRRAEPMALLAPRLPAGEGDVAR